MRPEEMIGKVLGHYKIVRSLGVGGTATVFLAQDINLQRDVALKLFQPQEGETRDFLRRFAREARVVAQLDHPNILPVYDYGEQDNRAYLVMPQMAGSLRDRLQGKKLFSPSETLNIIGPILNALQYAHDRGLIHRDIKPGNILFKADGTPVLSDFGLVKVLTPSNEQTMTFHQTASMTGQTIAGTPDYMSPEQISNQVTAASDIYSIGIVLYEMLTGTRPFSADSYLGVLMKQMYEQPRPLRSLNPSIPAPVEQVVLRALDKDGTKRYQRPNELQQALTQAIQETTSTTQQALPFSYATDPMPTVKQGVEQGETISSQHSPSFPVPSSTAQASYITPTNSTTPAMPITPPSTVSNIQSNRSFYNQQQATPAPLPVPTTATFPPQRRSSTPLLVGLIALVLLLLGGVGDAFLVPPPFGFARRDHTQQTPQATSPSTPVTKGNITPTAATGTTPTTQKVPATTTACPSSGTAPAAVMAPLVLGSHRNVIYTVNEFSGSTPTFGTVKRHDIDTNAKGIEIAKMAGVRITEAQVSQDGQWVLFVAQVGNQFQLRLVRVDGQGLQTLYCGASNDQLVGSQWSFDQQQVVFADTNQDIVYLLNVQNGSIQPEFVPQGQLAFLPRTWLDKTHVYLLGVLLNASATLQGLYQLDLQKGSNQHDSDLKQIATFSHECDSFDTSYDLTQLLLSTCSISGTQTSFNGPSSITAQPIAGGSIKNLYSNPTYAITMIRAVTPTQLLIMVENKAGDTSQNGLWTINTDGSNPTRLSTDTTGSQSLCLYSQYAWSNVSRDSTMYALESYQSSTNTYALYYGALSGSQPTPFASISDGTQLFLAGWTTM